MLIYCVFNAILQITILIGGFMNSEMNNQLFKAKTTSQFHIGNGQSVFIKTSWTRTRVYVEIIETEASSVDEAFYNINTKVTKSGLYIILSCIRELMHGKRTIYVIPTCDSVCRMLNCLGFARTRTGVYVY